MKCIYCDSDTNYKTRQSNGSRCGSCGHAFAFEPRTNPLSMADMRFQKIVRDVSGDNTLFFTEKELWYEFNRNLWRRKFWKAPWGGAAAATGLSGLVTAMAVHSGWPLLIGIAAVVVCAVQSKRAPRPSTRHPRLVLNAFLSDYLGRWLQTHGRIERLLPTLVPRPAPPPRGAEPDLTAYSFDRALVTDKADTAAMLVANNFHFENNCAILSADGYPYDIAATVMTMLRRNPELKVFALHDASVEGCALSRRLREERWFPDPAIRITDLGLLPRHAQKLGMLTLADNALVIPTDLRVALTADEGDWLEKGERAELAAMRPARLMRAVYQGFARSNQVGGDSGTGSDGGIWFYDSGADVYAADSFG
jgi:hypothetical protein